MFAQIVFSVCCSFMIGMLKSKVLNAAPELQLHHHLILYITQSCNQFGS